MSKNKDTEILKNLGEFGLIDNIKSWIDSKNLKSNDNVIGIGDDSAVVKNFNNNLLTSIDTLVEGTHFTKEITSFYDLGWKSLAVNISDISAMGGVPKYALISFACPDDTKIDDLKQFYFGFQELAELASVQLIGGDTVRTSEKIVVSVSIIGETIDNNYFLRSGAKVGDYVCATGTFGDSAVGLKQLLQDNLAKNYFTEKFNRPMPRFKEAKILGEQNLANSMIDVSDGLVFSLYELSEKSKIGILLEENKIPVSKQIKQIEHYLDYALYGGEDYELIFTVSEKNIKTVLNSLENVNIIGKISADFQGVKIKYKTGELKNLQKKGYSAF
jgi:thiamine-monophosphate kinase